VQGRVYNNNIQKKPRQILVSRMMQHKFAAVSPWSEPYLDFGISLEKAFLCCLGHKEQVQGNIL
jgi:hypothetical protein